MQSKSTTSLQTTQHLIAGLLQNDNNIEFFGIPETMEVQWIQNGKSHSFKDLDKKTLCILANAYNSNKEAQRVLEEFQEDGEWISHTRKLELYTYFMYGGCDNTPDIVDGKLQQAENFRHSENCVSLKFKKIRLNGSPLKPREIKMIDLMAKDLKDEVIAAEMGLAVSTYNQHKKEMFNKTGIQTKPALMMTAVRQRVARFTGVGV